jgi:chromosome segregation ATPase
MGKVVTLLKNLSEKIAAEGTREAAEYDKYACFCKEQADEKQYAIDKSNEKIKYLKAEIDELQTAKAELDSDISALNNNIAELEQQIDRKTNKRARQHDEYLAVAQDMNEAINACDDAIDAMKSSKKSMKGAKLDLTQVTSGLVKVVQRQALLTSAPGAVALLAKLDDTKGAPKFQYHSNDIIATLEDLSDTFKKQKKQN